MCTPFSRYLFSLVCCILSIPPSVFDGLSAIFAGTVCHTFCPSLWNPSFPCAVAHVHVQGFYPYPNPTCTLICLSASLSPSTLILFFPIIQDPFMFSGTVRYNLDPFHQCSDAEVWEALDRVHMGEFVRSLANQLDAPISEGGGNLSLGQRQLVCIARALLRHCNVVSLVLSTMLIWPSFCRNLFCRLSLQVIYATCMLTSFDVSRSMNMFSSQSFINCHARVSLVSPMVACVVSLPGLVIHHAINGSIVLFASFPSVSLSLLPLSLTCGPFIASLPCYLLLLRHYVVCHCANTHMPFASYGMPRNLLNCNVLLCIAISAMLG